MSLPCSRLQPRPNERASAPRVTEDLRQLLADAGVSDAEKRGRGCARPVRLVGSTMVVNPSTGEVGHCYSSSQELDGTTYVRCGNRRAEVCPSCSAEYKGDAWHLILCGLAGGKRIPESVADHPCTFATFTAPSFGSVHGVRQKGPCRARRDKPVCEHGRPLWCNARHRETTGGSARHCARTATTTPGTWCGSGTPPSCGAGSRSRISATSPGRAGCRSRRSGSGASSPTQWWSSRPAG